MTAYWNLLKFAADYGMIKCLLTMCAGTLGMGVLLTARKLWKDTGAGQYILLLLFPLAFTGMSRLFFMRGTVWITCFLNRYVKPVHGRFYFAVCGLLLFRSILARRSVNRYVRSLPLWRRPEEMEAAVETVAGKDLLSLGRRYLGRVRVYVTGEDISPFCGGLLRPYIVIPRTVAENWLPSRRKLALCHELLHIRQGHILWISLFQLLKIYWWANPAIYFYTRLLQEDMELACDERCVAYTDATPSGYGKVMLDMLVQLVGREPEGSLAFLKNGDFKGMKRRLKELARLERRRPSRRKYRLQAVCFALGAALLSSAVAMTSYPRYTRMKELALYDEQLNLLDYDSEQLREAVRIQDGRVALDKERFAALMSERKPQGEYVYLSFDTIMKVPGVGGGGNVGMICLSDYDDIFYLAADCMENKVAVFCLKYLM